MLKRHPSAEGLSLGLLRELSRTIFGLIYHLDFDFDIFLTFEL